MLVISTILVIAVNANTINIAKALWENDTLRSEVVPTVERTPQENSSHSDNTILQGDKRIEAKSLFPIGWENENFTCSFFWWLKAIVGWLITIFAVSLGAPFWFDLLGKISSIRKSVKAEKNVPESQKAPS